jgi:hypothetical protein
MLLLFLMLMLMLVVLVVLLLLFSPSLSNPAASEAAPGTHQRPLRTSLGQNENTH